MLKSSFVIGVVLRLWSLCVNAYKNSCLGKNICFLGNMAKESKTGRLINAYVNKAPFYKNSLIYRLFAGLYSVFDKLMAVINRGLVAVVKGSIFCCAAEEIYKKGYAVCGLSVIAMGICIGVAVSGSVISLLGVAVFLIIALVCKSNVLKNCFIYRFFCWLVKL